MNCNAHTVDGSEIRRSPVDMVNLPLFKGFYTSQAVVWDFFHQQYHSITHIKDVVFVVYLDLLFTIR